MKHHIHRAKHVYNERGLTDMARSAVTYVPIELNNAIFRLRHSEATHVMSEDWDTLIILDACRFDMFAERVPFAGQLETRISLGSTSEEFLRQNFAESQHHDTVYVNANVYFPKVGLNQDGTFHAVVDLLDDWDDDLEIAHPETVTEAAKQAHKQYPDKRVIVHYMQPHIPFIGEQGRNIINRIGNRNAWVPFRNGESPITIQRLWDGYNENLDLVFEYVDNLLSEIDGKIVLSADHGNMVGERQYPVPTKRMFGHPWGVYTPELVKVPWFIINDGRRTISSDRPDKNLEDESYSNDFIKQRLKSLGYR